LLPPARTMSGWPSATRWPARSPCEGRHIYDLTPDPPPKVWLRHASVDRDPVSAVTVFVGCHVENHRPHRDLGLPFDPIDHTGLTALRIVRLLIAIVFVEAVLVRHANFRKVLVGQNK